MTIENEKSSVNLLGQMIGFGNMMYLASECWRESLAEKGYPVGAEFQVGTCVLLTTPCGCESPKDCDWCCGSGWLTKKVKEVKDVGEEK